MFKARDVDDSFGKAAAAYGNPASLLSDNGAVFTGRYRGTGRVALEVTLHTRGISFRHSRPYHPQTCGKVERFHQTLKKWLTRQPPTQTTAPTTGPARQLPRLLQHHPATPCTTPPHPTTEPTSPDPRHYPPAPRYTDGSYRIRHDRIDSNGKLTLRHNSRLHHLGMGRRYAGTNVLILVHDLHIRVLTTDGELLRELQLDPTKDYQPQPKP